VFTPNNDMTTTGPIDIATFESLKQTTGADFAAELADTFLAEAPAMLAELGRARDAADAESFRRTAHSLKSNSMTFGALPLGAMAKSLELSGISAAGRGDVPSLEDVAAEYARVAATLKGLAHG
jgi:HPt (histidine-containing phosphotransfer) domain-containing protein